MLSPTIEPQPNALAMTVQRTGAIQSDAAYVGDSTMMEGWPLAAAAKLSDAAFLAILQAHPGLRDRLVLIALAVMNAEGNLKEADVLPLACARLSLASRHSSVLPLRWSRCPASPSAIGIMPTSV